MSIIQRYAGWLKREATAMPPFKAEVMRQVAKKLTEIEAENNRLRADEVRIDWLADPNNTIGNVQLPEKCVLHNLDSLRAAIDAAMAMEEA